MQEIFTTELARALNPSSRHGCQEQKSTDPSLCYNILDGKFIKQRMYPDNNHIFVKRTSDDIHNIATENLEPAQKYFHIAIKVDDSYQFKGCSSQDSERNDFQEQSSCSTLSAPIVKIRDKIDDTNCVCEESVAEPMSISAADNPELFTPKNVSSLPPKACNDNLFSESSNLLKKEHSSNVSQKETDSNVSCLPSGLPLSPSVVRVKVELTDGNADVQLSEVGVSETDDSLDKTLGANTFSSKFSCSNFVVNKERNTICSYTPSRGAPIVEKHQTCSHMADQLTDSVLSTFHAMVKNEPSEGDDVPCTFETNSKESPSYSVFGLPNNTFELNSLQTVERFSEAGNCQNISPCRVSGLQCNHESTINSPEIDLSADALLVTGGKNTCMTTQSLVSDVSAFKVFEKAGELQENLAKRISDCTTESLSSSCPLSTLGLKPELMEDTTYNLFDTHLGSLSSDVRVIEAKSEVISAPSVDILDLMPLSERIRMLTSTMASDLKPARKSKCFKQTRVHAVIGCDSVDSLKFKSETSTRRRKRKKTATLVSIFISLSSFHIFTKIFSCSNERIDAGIRLK